MDFCSGMTMGFELYLLDTRQIVFYIYIPMDLISTA